MYLIASNRLDNKNDPRELLVSDVRYARASTEFRASFFGLDEKVLAQTQNRALMKNMPELAEQQQMIEHSNNHAQRLVKFFDGLSSELTMMTDENALSNRVDESTL
jgi:nucleoid-associated protein YejK